MKDQSLYLAFDAIAKLLKAYHPELDECTHPDREIGICPECKGEKFDHEEGCKIAYWNRIKNVAYELREERLRDW